MTRGKALQAPPPPPSTISEAAEFLRIADMHELLTGLGAMPVKSRPRKRAEFIDLLVATGATDEVLAAARPRYELAVDDHLAGREAAKCELLAHTLSMRAYALRDRRKRVGKAQGVNIRPTQAGCPVEAAYASRFMTGELTGDPPFFPGDRTSLVVDFDD